eukprot:CAMPEP_0171105634 /NCGR_PEP_ID=MMETSP0766_2-20121228/63125_1 /TAXON_ID=439317 /ORGANISM="Gambierdiscus australes, Strain CAWD 149" /LENGTH=54 /DNA_ID=CAMNT_0011566547 /DNA_START=158 /DNA_END=318 /DNA_ORIENTATION=+
MSGRTLVQLNRIRQMAMDGDPVNSCGHCRTDLRPHAHQTTTVTTQRQRPQQHQT